MKCPECEAQTTVVDSRRSFKHRTVRRRRECTRKSCAIRFTTHETVMGADAWAVLPDQLLRVRSALKAVPRIEGIIDDIYNNLTGRN